MESGPIRKEEFKPSGDGFECRVSVKLLSGQSSDSGLECTALLQGFPNVHMKSLVMRDSDVQLLPESSGGEASVSQVQWTARHLQAFQERKGAILLEANSKALQPAEWKVVYEKIDLTPE